MDKDTIYNHSITLNERKNLVITGVKKIDSFDNEEFLLETNMGYMVIKGKELEIVKLDTYQGNVSIVQTRFSCHRNIYLQYDQIR